MHVCLGTDTPARSRDPAHDARVCRGDMAAQRTGPARGRVRRRVDIVLGHNRQPRQNPVGRGIKGGDHALAQIPCIKALKRIQAAVLLRHVGQRFGVGGWRNGAGFESINDSNGVES